MNKLMRVSMLLVLVALVLSACATPTPDIIEKEIVVTAAPEPVTPVHSTGEPFKIKVLTIAMFEAGEMSGDFPGEGQLWVEGENMAKVVEVTGANNPLYCNDKSHCVIVTDMGTANATATLLAIGLSPQFDLRETYFMVAGIAGTPPSIGTTGSAAWAEWVVNADLSHYIDEREMPEGWEFPVVHLGCNDPWCDGWTSGTEVFRLNPDLREWAYQLSKDVELADSKDAQAYRDNYPVDLPGSQPPRVLRCDSLDGDRYWHGRLQSEWATWWMKQWTGGEAEYCMTNMEDSGTLTALTRLAEAGLVDINRVLVLRTASNFDQQYPGQTAAESLRAENGGYILSIENAYRVGSKVAHHIIINWEDWRRGVPELSEEFKFKVAFVYVAPIGDLGWTWAHNQGRLAVEGEFGDEVETAYIENVPEGPEAERVIRDFANKGYDLVITTSFGYMDPTVAVAEEFPETWFVHISGYKTADNVSTVFGRMYQPRYLSGLVAGSMTESDIIGYVAAFPIPEVIRGINAFTLGVRDVNPDAEVRVVWTNTWFGPPEEKEAAEALLAEGADIIAQHQDTTEPQKAAADTGALSIGYDSDMSQFVGDTVLTSPVWDWGIKYVEITRQVMDGTYETESYWGGMQDDVVELAPMSAKVPNDVQDLVDEKKDLILGGQWNVFCGPIHGQNGDTFVPEGTCLSDDKMLNMNTFVEGVIGSIE